LAQAARLLSISRTDLQVKVACILPDIVTVEGIKNITTPSMRQCYCFGSRENLASNASSRLRLPSRITLPRLLSNLKCWFVKLVDKEYNPYFLIVEPPDMYDLVTPYLTAGHCSPRRPALSHSEGAAKSLDRWICKHNEHILVNCDQNTLPCRGV
jgi:hypothetical protein